MSTVRLGADELWYDDLGGEGVPFVLLHPGITDSRVWDPLLPQLVDKRVIRFDRRGFGRSPRATESYSSLGDLVGLLDALDIARAHLVGNSMGGEASLALALSAPERVASMTLLCPGINGYPWPDTDEPDLEAEWLRCKEAGDLAGLAAIQRNIWFASGSDDYLDEQVLDSVTLDFSPAAAFEQENPEQWSRVASLDVPTSVIAGELDPADSLQASVDLAEKIPGAVLVRLPVDHVPQYRDPEAVAEVVLATADRAI
ncbi:MAG: alpha/beta fold hydrolase [Marmoricola sp.]